MRARVCGAHKPRKAFDFRAILAAHRKSAGHEYTDDAAIAEAADLAVTLVEGDAHNLKVTEPADFAIAEALIQSFPPSLREGHEEGQ